MTPLGPVADVDDHRHRGVVALDAPYDGDGRVRRHPAIDVTRVLTTAELVVGAVLVARRLAARPSGAKALVTMGPGGWVSMKGGAMVVRPAERGWRRRRTQAAVAGARTRRPWWARVLSAKALQSVLADAPVRMSTV